MIFRTFMFFCALVDLSAALVAYEEESFSMFGYLAAAALFLALATEKGE